MTNHYDTLGVAEDASPDDIKRAYRKLAMQYHPDRNQGNADATEKFKQINEAYEHLGDENKRRTYDDQRRFGDQMPGAPGGNPFNFHFNMGGMPPEFNDLFSQIFGQNPFRQPARNRDLQFALNISLEEAYAGKAVPLQFKDASGNPVNLSVNIPAGVEHGTQIRYAGHGDRQHSNLPPGDLYVHINISEHDRFVRSGPHLHMRHKVNALDAMIGGSFTVTCIDGGTISVSLPRGTQHGARLSVRGRGMPMHNNSQQRGDMQVEIAIEIPTRLTDKQIELLKQAKDGAQA